MKLGVRWAMAMLLAGACEQSGPARTPTRPPSTDDLSGIRLQELKIRPSLAPAAQYGEPRAHALSPVENAIAEQLGAIELQHLPALSAMTRELARTSPDDINVPPALVDALMARAGLVDPPPRLVVVELGNDRGGCQRAPNAGCQAAIASLAEQAASLLPGDALGELRQNVRFGVGVVGLSGGRTRMMVALLELAVALEPMPTAVQRDGSIALHGRLLGPRQHPHVEVVDSRGSWITVPVGISVDGSFNAEVRCADQGIEQVEVLADGPHGPEVVANFPLHCGVRPPDTITVVVEEVDADVSADQIARANFIYLNEERERRGLAPVAWDPDAAGVARGHSEDMRDHGFVGHHSPRTGDVTARFERAGMTGTVIRENVARGYGPKGIHDSLMRSPGHRVNILAPDVTHVGVGAVLGPKESDVPGAPRPVFATQNYYKKPGAGAPPEDQLATTLQSRVDGLRREAGLPAVGWDPGLSAIAAKQAGLVARGREPGGFEDAVFDLGWESVTLNRLSSIDFDALTTVELWRDRTLGAGNGVGIGVVRRKASRTEDAAFVVVVLVAERP